MRFLSLSCSLAATVTSRHNFGPASMRDNVLYTACRPGDPPGKLDAISDESVEEWINFMKEHGVHRVISLLDENEYSNYDADLRKQYADGGLEYLCQEIRQEGAFANISQYIHQAAANEEKVVAHCTGGIGRAGRVAAGWLVHRYGLTATEATEETLSAASKANVIRKGDVIALTAWLGDVVP